MKPIRIITSTSLFDGHDASINIMRRVMQDQGVEVIHLGHNRSALEIVEAAIDEDVQGIAITSYQGGHIEFFSFVRKLLNDAGYQHIKIVGGGACGHGSGRGGASGAGREFCRRLFPIGVTFKYK